MNDNTEQDIKKNEEKNNQTNAKTDGKTTYTKIPYFLLIAVVVILAFALGAGAQKHSQNDNFTVRTLHGMGEIRGFSDGGPRGVRGFGGMMGGGHFDADDDSSQNRAMGTVTAVESSGFTIAGHGATTKIQTSSSTKYINASSVKVNDTVMILGTSSNGTLQATQVIVNPGMRDLGVQS